MWITWPQIYTLFSVLLKMEENASSSQIFLLGLTCATFTQLHTLNYNDCLSIVSPDSRIYTLGDQLCINHLLNLLSTV